MCPFLSSVGPHLMQTHVDPVHAATVSELMCMCLGRAVLSRPYFPVVPHLLKLSFSALRSFSDGA